ncbi:MULTISPECIES: STN domain-containing protein [unclassified Sphingomonas]|uniref:STN domain-containing protein n=1 Tax=unclassified Sphingomonas TaxID=196159 RepID=UPI000700372B|nr:MULTISPECIES: STN domain-containing protein [unclassified Sphingomonas]KQX24278.1 hypothetical protein ASD17_25435 [Sphingomonas sp. Root1294]KQY69549.1 hypothetical protein ASD39_24600 [Sphingomonas sp. Root50]KRB87477.1 hypothetical protein ASE22_24150 [Sphingomonas sp. Root720]
MRIMPYGATVAVAALCCVASPAFAEIRHFNLPAQPAIKGIPAFGRQAGLRIIAPADGLKGRTTRPVRGDMDVQVALARLLDGTGLVDAPVTKQAIGTPALC